MTMNYKMTIKLLFIAVQQCLRHFLYKNMSELKSNLTSYFDETQHAHKKKHCE